MSCLSKTFFMFITKVFSKLRTKNYFALFILKNNQLFFCDTNSYCFVYIRVITTFLMYKTAFSQYNPCFYLLPFVLIIWWRHTFACYFHSDVCYFLSFYGKILPLYDDFLNITVLYSKIMKFIIKFKKFKYQFVI